MTQPFVRTTDALQRDRPIVLRAGIAFMLLVSAGWFAWMLRAQVPLYVVSDRARVEALSPHTIGAPVDGGVAAVYVALGQHVERGDILLMLDVSSERLARQQQELQAVSSSAAVQRLQREIALQSEALAEAQRAADATRAEAQARLQEGTAALRQAESEARRAALLYKAGLLSDTDRSRTDTDELQKRAAAASMTAALQRSTAQDRATCRAKSADLEKLRSQVNEIATQGESASMSARIAQAEIEKRTIRAPVSGTVATELLVRPGSVVIQGERITSILPSSSMQIVAYVPALAASGRIRAGQDARLALDAFPPIEYGWIATRVARVAAEPIDGLLRVDLNIVSANRRIPLQHGLAGVVEIETEKLSPWTLILRAAGKRLQG